MLPIGTRLILIGPRAESLSYKITKLAPYEFLGTCCPVINFDQLLPGDLEEGNNFFQDYMLLLLVIWQQLQLLAVN